MEDMDHENDSGETIPSPPNDELSHEIVLSLDMLKEAVRAADDKRFAYVHVRMEEGSHPLGTIAVELESCVTNASMSMADGSPIMVESAHRVGWSVWHRSADKYDRAMGRKIARGRAEKSKVDGTTVIVYRKESEAAPGRYELLQRALLEVAELGKRLSLVGMPKLPARFTVAAERTAARLSSPKTKKAL